MAAAALMMAAGAFADNYDYTLRVNLKEGEKVDFLFSRTPVATFTESDMVITADQGTSTVAYPMANVANMEIVSTSVAVESIKAESVASFALEADILNGAGLKADAEVAIFSVNGQMIARTATDSDGRFSISIANLAKGVYVVNAGGVSFKFIK